VFLSFFLLFLFFFFFRFSPSIEPISPSIDPISPSIDCRQSKSTADSRFLPQSAADGRNRPPTVGFWRYCPVAGGPRTGNLADRMYRPYQAVHVLEANERKVGLVRFIPIDNEREEELDNKGVNQVVSKKVIKQKKQTVNKPDKLCSCPQVGLYLSFDMPKPPGYCEGKGKWVGKAVGYEGIMFGLMMSPVKERR
ncbi:hypothetical protein B296_00045552, partial [Ensete ventricosum]